MRQIVCLSVGQSNGRSVSQPVGWWVNRSMHWLGEIVEIFQKGYVTLDHVFCSSKACFSRHRYGFIGNQTETTSQLCTTFSSWKMFYYMKESFVSWRNQLSSNERQKYESLEIRCKRSHKSVLYHHFFWFFTKIPSVTLICLKRCVFSV